MESTEVFGARQRRFWIGLVVVLFILAFQFSVSPAQEEGNRRLPQASAPSGFPKEGKKALKQWVEMNKQACINLKNVVDTGYSNLENFFGAQGSQP